MYPNIEKSAFRKGEYVGYGPAGVYRIKKLASGYWRASCQNPRGSAYHGIEGKTLRFLSERIAVGPSA